jgi:outer membrane protein assembly factor BamB
MDARRIRRSRGLLAVLIAAATGISLAQAHPAAGSWERPHADGANTGFVDLVTAPAGRGSVSVPDLGSFAPGAGPVIAPDGTVYLGNQQGKLMSFKPDGTRGWSRDVLPGQSIVASPVIDSQGSVYVIGVKSVRDHRGGGPPVTRHESTLHKFSSGGAWIGRVPFPHRFDGAAVSAPPNIWRSGGAEAIMVPISYEMGVNGGFEVRLVAFSTSGEIMADTLVTRVTQFPPLTAGSDFKWWCVIPPLVGFCLRESYGFEGDPYSPPDPADRLPDNTVVPQPGVATFTYATGGTQWILVSDGFQDLVGYTFSGTRFNEVFRVHDDARLLTTPPMVLPNGHTIIGAMRMGRSPRQPVVVEVVFAGPNGSPPRAVTYVGRPSTAAPTRLSDGRIVFVRANGGVVVLQGTTLTSNPVGESIASAAASRTHVFVSTAGAFLTYDTNSMAEVARFSWVGGGLSPPAIGPQGHVYAIASNVLFVFPPPRLMPKGGQWSGPEKSLGVPKGGQWSPAPGPVVPKGGEWSGPAPGKVR